ncbi:MAG TPA: septum site-determining protein MinC [Spirochaetia bacterium]|nr:septum site-determining protein MinC [Spirochaetia bacterium]
MSQEPVSIKGSRHGLIIRLTEDQDFSVIKKDLRSKMEASRGFFRGARYTLNREVALSGRQQDELDEICREFGMIPGTSGIPGPKPRSASPLGEPAFLAAGNLRSGQRLAHPGHVVVLGNIHPGAEVAAGHNLLVLGACRGTVEAGTAGDAGAMVLALSLEPVRLSIAGQLADSRIFGSSPAGLVVARLQNGHISLEAWRRSS